MKSQATVSLPRILSFHFHALTKRVILYIVQVCYEVIKIPIFGQKFLYNMRVLKIRDQNHKLHFYLQYIFFEFSIQENERKCQRGQECVHLDE